MNSQRQLKQLMQTLPPKQQTLDFGSQNLWQQLPAEDRRACRDAIAAFLYQVAVSTPENPEHSFKENKEDER
jgi:hypothetical protein